MKDVVIIGGGAAGMTAAMYIARAGLDALVLERALVGGQASTANMIENYPGFPDGIGGPELMLLMEEQARRAGAEIDYIDVKNVELSGATKYVESIPARAVIIASGAQMRKLGVPGESENIGRGVSYCATCDGALYRGKTVAVIGGGNTAVEDAIYLSRFARVFLIHRREQLRARGARAEKALSAVAPLLGKNVLKIDRVASGLRLSLDDGKSLDVDGVFVAVGTQPSTDIFKGILELTADGYIDAAEDTRTNIPGVFAAGDCRKKPLRQIITAASDGAIAAAMAMDYLNA